MTRVSLLLPLLALISACSGGSGEGNGTEADRNLAAADPALTDPEGNAMLLPNADPNRAAETEAADTAIYGGNAAAGETNAQ